jgi:threonine dehydratase
VVPDHAPQTKLDAMLLLGAEYVKVPFAEWFEILQTRHFDGMDGYFIHPVSDPHVMAGNGTIGLEIYEDLPDVDVVVIPFGGGGLSCGIASALRALKPDIKIYACEVETAAPVAASFRAGRAMTIDYQPSFVDGIGSPMVLEEMWPLVRQLLDGSLTVSVDETAKALRLIAERNRVIAEGAGAVSAAVALSGQAGTGKVVCVVSGGNIDSGKLTTILQGKVP